MDVDSGRITQSELQAELDTLRSLRRRSVSRPSDGIDPDLPPSPSKYSNSSGSPPTSPTTSSSPLASSSSSSFGSSSQSDAPVAGPSRFPDAIGQSDLDYEARDDLPLGSAGGNFGEGSISDLFWLPARLHPEIAPQEFRNFIRDQTNPENLMRRSGSMLGRKKSTLSKQYIPSESDNDSGNESSRSNSISRTPSRTGSFRRNTGLERLTLNDLQRLEKLARQSAEEGQQGEESEAQLKRLVRRSLSLNPAAILGAADQLGDEDNLLEGDETDSPLIVPPPGSILRRSARTKIRKNSLLGDGGGHRFGPSKRTPRGVYGGTVSENGEDEYEGNSRTVSVGSLGSLESGEDHLGDRSERDITPEPLQYSPEKMDYSAPLPPQYMAPLLSDTSGSRDAIQAASQTYQDQITITPARAGADMPKSNASPSPPQQMTSLPQTSAIPMRTKSPEAPLNTIEQSRQEAAEKLTASMVGTGSLRTTRAPGTQPAGGSIPAPPIIAPHSGSVRQTDQSAFLAQSPNIVNANTPLNQPEARPTPPQKTMDDSNVLRQQQLRQQRSQERVSPQFLASSSSPIVHHPQAQQAHPPNPTLNDPRRQQGTPNIPPQPVSRPTPSQQSPPVPPPAKEHKEKKSKWAKLGLSRSSKDDSSDFDDTASTMSASSTSGGFSIAGAGKKGKKGKKDKQEPVAEVRKPQHSPGLPAQTEKEKEKEKAEGGGFFGGLFGSKKKAESAEHEKKEPQSAHLQLPTPPPTASGMLTADGTYVNFYRLPIHIERAVYRLSHIKLANPRRPLFEQVLISNLMFWYLGVINKPAVPPSQMQQQQQQHQHMRHGPQNQDRSQHMQQPNGPASPPQRPGMMREKSDSGTPQDGMPPAIQTGMAPTIPMSDYRPPLSEVTVLGANQNQRPQSHPPSSPPKQGPPDDVHPAGQIAYQSRASAPSTPNYAQTGPPDTYLPNPTDATSQPPHWPQRGASMATTNLTSQPQSGPPADTARQTASMDVHYDGRRKTADLDTYDIISAYADEERRKSMLVQDTAPPVESKGTGMPRTTPFDRTRSNSLQEKPDAGVQADSFSRPPRSASRTASPSTLPLR